MSKKKPFEHEIDPEFWQKSRNGSSRSMTSRRDITSPTLTLS